PHPFYAGWRRLSGRDKCNRNNSDRVAHRRAAWRAARAQTTLVCVRRRKISSACFPPRFFVLYGAARAARRRAALFIRTTSCQKLAGASLGDAGWSSPVARQAHNLKVVGSNPTPATNVFLVDPNQSRFSHRPAGGLRRIWRLPAVSAYKGCGPAPTLAGPKASEGTD